MLGTWLSYKTTRWISDFVFGNRSGKAPTVFTPWPVQQRPFREAPTEIQRDIVNAADWQDFRENPPHILGGRTRNDLGHRPGCDCIWCT